MAVVVLGTEDTEALSVRVDVLLAEETNTRRQFSLRMVSMCTNVSQSFDTRFQFYLPQGIYHEQLHEV